MMQRNTMAVTSISAPTVVSASAPFHASLLFGRSHMNVTFRLPSEEQTDAFVKQADKLGMTALKGYRSVGGIRASIYNAMPLEGCQALAAFMKEFAAKNG